MPSDRPSFPAPPVGALASVVPLLASAGILLAGNGLQVTLVAVRANLEGFPATSIGLLGTAYFFGFIVGCLATSRLIARAGHIRVFAAMAALAATTTLLLATAIEPWVWFLARALAGLCFSSLFAVIESWLNEKAEGGSRGRILSLYRIVDLSAVTGSQFLLPVFGPEGFTVFAVAAMLLCLAVVPVTLSRAPSPRPLEEPKFSPRAVWAISPVACFGCITLGLTNSAVRTMGPVYAQEMGLAVDQVALFVSAVVVGGAALQYPLGWLSDRTDRRWALMIGTVGAMAAGLLLTLTSGNGTGWLYLGALLFGGFAMPLYSLSVAHAADQARPEQYVQLSVGLLLFYSLGAMVGPLGVATVIDLAGPGAFFIYTSCIHGVLVVFILYRRARRRAVRPERKRGFVGLLRTSPALLKLAGRRNGG